MAFEFKPAVKERMKLRLALTGIAGSGKSYSALAIACRIAELEGGVPGVIDTEHDRARLYSDRFKFEHLSLEAPFSPERYIAAIEAAERAGFPVVVIDSLSHAWMGKGGVLNIVDEETERLNSKNKFATGWRVGTPEQDKLVEAILQCRIHVIATMRSKSDYLVEDGGRSIKKIGTAPVQRDNIDFEFDLVGDLHGDHRMVIVKSRSDALADKTFIKPGADFANQVVAWLNSGADPEPKQNTSPAQTAVGGGSGGAATPAPAAAPVHTNGHSAEPMPVHEAMTQMNGAARTVADVRKSAGTDALAAFGAFLKAQDLDAELACELLGIDTADGAKAALGRYGKARTWQTAQREIEAKLILQQRAAGPTSEDIGNWAESGLPMPADDGAEQPELMAAGGGDPVDGVRRGGR